MTDADLLRLCEEALTLAQKTTPGPWESDGEVVGWWSGEQPAVRVAAYLDATRPFVSAPVCMVHRGSAERNAGQPLLEDAALIAHAGTHYATIARALKERLETET